MTRPAGTPNKKKQVLIALLQAKYPGYHPVMEMAAIANDPDNSVEMRSSMHKEIAGYVEPKRKAVELSGNIDASVVYKPIVKRLDGSMDEDS